MPGLGLGETMSAMVCRAVALAVLICVIFPQADPVAAASTLDNVAGFNGVVPTGIELKLRLFDDTEVQGKIVRFNEDRQVLILHCFIPAEGRFDTREINTGVIRDVRGVERHQKVLPVLGAAFLGATLGATLGYLLGDDGWQGDVQGSDTRPALAVGLGAVGGFVGLSVGAIMTPKHQSESILWSRED
jgi:hypothetical protein